MSDQDQATCTCPLIEITTLARRPRGEREYLRGDPRGSGCPLHETIEMRVQLWAAEQEARYGNNRAVPTPVRHQQDPPPEHEPWRHCRSCRKTDPAAAAEWHLAASRWGLVVAVAGLALLVWTLMRSAA